MSFLLRLLRRPTIKNGYSFLDNDTGYSLEVVKKSLFTRDYYDPLPNTFDSVTLSFHAFHRWNERIGPHISYQELIKLLNQLILIKGRLTKISDRRGLIDSDILFIYQQKGNKIHITTFYGRLSLNPSLRNIRDLKAYQLMEKERIILKLPNHILQSQHRPVLPIEYIEFEGRMISYVIQEYRVAGINSEEILLFLTETTKFGKRKMIVIDPDNVFETLLNHSVLYVLFTMGYRKFVLEHLQFYKPDAVLKSLEKYDEYVSKKLRLRNKFLTNMEKHQ